MAEPIGEITILHGKAVAEGPDGARELAVGSPIYNNETISTGLKGAIEIQFTDGALLSQGPNSKVHLDDYVFDPDNDMGEITMDLMEGTFRSVTGQIVDMNPEGFKIDTPNTTIGIRGTTTGHIIGADGEEQHVCIDFDNKPVVVQSLVGGPPAIISGDGMGVSAGPRGLGAVGPAPANVLESLEQLSSRSLQERAPQGEQEGENPDDNPEGGETGETGESGEVGQEPQEDQLDGGGELPTIDVLPPQGLLPPVLPPVGLPDPVQPPIPLKQDIPIITKDVPPIPDPIPDLVSASPQTVLDLSTETTPVTVNLVGGSPPYWEVTGDSSTRVDIDETVYTVIGSQTQSNNIIGDEQNNILTGGQVNDTIVGGDGIDTIYGMGDYNMSGGDSLDGGAGVGDLLSYANLGVAIDKTDISTVNYTMGASQQDTVTGFENFEGTIYNDVIYGDSNHNRIYGLDGNDLLWGGGGTDSLYGGRGDDSLKVEGTIDGGVLDGGDDIDTIQVYADADLSALSSVKDVEKFGFQMGDKVLTVEARDFTGFDSGASAYTIYGMDGNHTFNVNAGATSPSDETINLSSMTFDSWTSPDVLNINGNSGNDVLTGAVSVAQTINGGAGNDKLYGGSVNDTIVGGDGIDTIYGMGDNNMSSGGDSLDGGAGIGDMLSYANLGVAISKTSETEVSYTQGASQLDTITGFENFEGSNYNDVIYGDSNSNKLFGLDGNDLLWGSGGTNSLFGGSGNDTLKVEGTFTGEIDGGNDTDTIQVYANTDMSNATSVANVEKIAFNSGDKTLTVEARDFSGFDTGANMYSIDGNGGNNTFKVKVGSTSGETVNLSSLSFTSWDDSVGADALLIEGNAGNDNISGASKGQSIFGYAGNDVLYGGVANDTLDGGDDNDKLFGSVGNDSMDGGAGVDTVTYINAGSAVTANLGSGANNVSIDGNGGQDTIVNFEVFEASNNNDVITTSNDSTVSQEVYARGGNDWVKYVTNGNNQGMEIDLGDGADRLTIDGNVAVGASLNGCAGDDTLECNGNAVVDGTGFGLIQYVENFIIGGGATSLSMSYAAVTGQSWAASVSNGCTLTVKGDVNANAIDMSTYDSLNLNTSGSLVVNGDAGDDSLNMGSYMSSLVTYDGGSDTDSLQYTDTGGSNELDNVTNVERIIFNDGSNVNVTTVNSLVASGQTLNVSGANLSSSYSLTWEGWAEMDGRFNITGGAGGDQIFGGAGNDYISGGAGADYLRGGEGTDMLNGGAGADTFVYEMPSQGGDGIQDFNTAEDLFHFSKSDFDGGGDILTTGTLNSDFFTVVTDATYLVDGVAGLGATGDMNGANDHFIYFKDGSSFELYYDSDGDGSASPTLIASFDSDIGLTNADIILV